MYYFAIRKCPHPVVIEISDEALLKEHNRVFSQESHWAFPETEKAKALKWANVRASIKASPTVSYPFYDKDTNEWLSPLSGKPVAAKTTEIPDPVPAVQGNAPIPEPIPAPVVSPPPPPPPAPVVIAEPAPPVPPVVQPSVHQEPVKQSPPVAVSPPQIPPIPVQVVQKAAPIPQPVPEPVPTPPVYTAPQYEPVSAPAPQPQAAPVYQPAAPVQIPEPPHPQAQQVPIVETPETKTNTPSTESPSEVTHVHMSEESNSLMLSLDMLRAQGYAFVQIKTVLGETFYAVLDDILYWSSNLVPSMFTPVYGSCDFRVRGTFNAKHDWNDMFDIEKILSGSDGLELSSVVISSHRNLTRDADNFGMLKVLQRVNRTCMGDYVFFDHLFGGIKRNVDKDTAHAAFGQAESLTYEGEKDIYDHVLNSHQVVSLVPFFVDEEVKNDNIISAYYRMYPLS